LRDAAYQVSLNLKSGFQFCGGSIISPIFILTAAHCTIRKLAGEIIVRVGSKHKGVGGELFRVRKINDHPLYDGGIVNFDFSLLKLAKAIVLKPGVKEIIQMPALNAPSPLGPALASGWGATNNTKESELILRGVILPILSDQKCKEIYPDMTSQKFCAGNVEKGGVSVCFGDSGGEF
jgi:trypsin